ncbi:MAG TPA: S41 family peptidase [Caulobacteraceae bacterium]|nr:S41 family peptidase [Caulobacteraceae bacterium]
MSATRISPVLAALALAACASQPPDLHLAPGQWRADLKTFATELPARHMNAFHFTSQAAFQAAVADLDRRLDGLDGDQSSVGLEQLARMIGDGHTGFHTPEAFEAQLPIKVQHFGDEVRIVEAAPGAEPLLGQRLVAINGAPIAEVNRRLLTVTPADEGMGVRQGVADRRMTLGLYLHGLGITPTRGSARLTVAGDDGRTSEVDLVPTIARAGEAWTSVQATTPLMRQHENDPMWCATPAPGVLYCDFRSYQGLAGPAATMRAEIARTHPDKLVIDMRQNGGGDFNVGLRNVVDPIRDDPTVNRKGHLFVLIGPMTFSAGMSNSAHFRQRTAAILVGEPIGERPNSYQENRELTLPNSHLVLSYSTRFYESAPGDPANEIRPDVEVPTPWDAYKAGRDPVLEWVIAQP